MPALHPGSLEENRAGTCDFAAVAAGRRQYPRRIDLLFTPEEQFAAAIARRIHSDFSLSVRVSSTHLPLPATAHYRGQGSFGCSRANYTVNLEGSAPRFLMPSSAQSRFHLISMCLDRLYLRTFSVFQILREEGLFPNPFELAELSVDGVSQGVYFLTENSSPFWWEPGSDVSARE